MYTCADRAATDKGGEDKGGAAAAAKYVQTTIGNRVLPEAAAVGLSNKFNQFSAFGKRASTFGMAASAIAHKECSVLSEDILGTLVLLMLPMRIPLGS